MRGCRAQRLPDSARYAPGRSTKACAQSLTPSGASLGSKWCHVVRSTPGCHVRDAREETESMPEVLLVRHAAAEGQNADAPLTSEGCRQASILARVLLPFSIQRVICSPYLRAIQTAEPFCERASLRIVTDSRLVERVLSARNLPDWREHLRRSFDDLDYRLEDGESARAAQDRGAAVLREALAVPERCAVVTHGNLLALILKWVDATAGYDAWSQLSNPDTFMVYFDDPRRGRFRRVWQPSGLTNHSSAPA